MLTVSQYRNAIGSWLARFDDRAYCPHCRRYLGGWLSLGVTIGPPPVVVATRHCPKCGGRVLAEPISEPDTEPPALPTRDEYRLADRQHQTWGGLLIGLVVAGGFLGCFASGSFLMNLTALPHGLRVGLTLWGMLTPFVAGGVILWLMVRRARNNEHLTCAWCGEVLAGQGEIVQVSGRCVFCGRPTIAGEYPDAPPGPHKPLTTRENIIACVAARDRSSARAVGLWAVLTALGIATALTPSLIFGSQWEFEHWLAPRIGENEAMQLARSGPLAVGLGASAVGLLVGGLLEWRSRVRYPFDCPTCGKGFTPGLAIASGRCNQCFQPVVY